MIKFKGIFFPTPSSFFAVLSSIHFILTTSVYNGTACYGRKGPDLVNICWALTTSQAVSWADILTHLILITALLGRYFIFDLADEEIEAQRIRLQFKSTLCHLLAMWSWANNFSVWMFIFGAINGDNTADNLTFKFSVFLCTMHITCWPSIGQFWRPQAHCWASVDKWTWAVAWWCSSPPAICTASVA